MIRRERTVSEALELGQVMPFAYFARLSEISIGKTPDTISMDELTEARFFGADGEIRIYHNGSGMSAVELRDEPDDCHIDIVSSLIPKFGKKIVKRQYVVPDEEGQCRIAAVRLLYWEE